MSLRKSVFFLLMFLLLNISIQVRASDDSEYLSFIEKSLFNTQYQNEGVDNRLNRIELNVFGKINQTPSQQRIEKLRKVFGNLNQNQQKPAQYNQPARVNQTKYTNLSKNPEENQSVRYPVVDEIEKKMIGKSLPNEDIYRRIERLEIVLFSKKYNDSLSERVDRLKLTVFGNQENPKQSNNMSMNAQTPLNEESAEIILSKLEKDTFNQSFSNETVEQRLERLENKVFNQSSSDYPVNERIERLATVVTAQPASELYQDMSKMRQYQVMSQRLTVAAMLMLLVKGLLF